MIITSLAIGLSTVLLLLLALRDPKRLRNLAKTSGNPTQPPLSSSVRRACAWLLPLPGIALAIAGEWWAFLVWCAVVTVLGWIIAQMLAIRAEPLARRRS